MSIAHPLTITLVAALSMAACSPASTLTVDARTCRPAEHQALVGMNIGEVYLPRELLQRTVSPGQVVTPEYVPGRLTMFVDPKGWIGKISCG